MIGKTITIRIQKTRWPVGIGCRKMSTRPATQAIATGIPMNTRANVDMAIGVVIGGTSPSEP